MRVCFGRSAWGCLILLLLMMHVAKAQEHQVLELKRAVEIALRDNPTLAASRTSVDAIQHELPQAGALPDPRLTLGLANMVDGFSLDNDPMSQLQIGITQALPFPGKLDLQEAVIEHRLAKAGQQLNEFERQLERQVKEQWWQLFYLDHALQTVKQNSELLEQVQANAETLYAVGRGQQRDILQAQLVLSKLEGQRLMLQEQRQVGQARLNGFMNRAWDSEIVIPLDTEQSKETLPTLPSTELLASRLLEQHPLLLGMQSEVAAAQSRRELSARERYPDFTVGAMYGMRDGREDLTSLQFSMTLPIYSGRKQSRAEDQRQAELIMSRQQLEAQRQQLMTELSVVLARYQQARDRIQLYNDAVLPQAEQNVEILLAAYESANANFQQLIKAQAELQSYKKEYWQAYSAAQAALASLVALTGEISYE